MNIELSSCGEIPDLIIPICIQLSDKEIQKLSKTEYQRQFAQVIDFHLISLHHVAKIENRHHKVPGKPKIRRALELQGKLLYTIFELCVGLHPRAINPYTNAHYWFLDVNKEILNGKLLQVLNPFEFDKKPKNGDKKRVITGIYNSEISAIKNLKNPFKNNVNLSKTSNLIDLTIAKSEISHKFKEKYLYPFIFAGRNVANSFLSSDWCVVSSQDGEVTCQRIGGHKKYF